MENDCKGFKIKALLNNNITIKVIYPLYNQDEINKDYKDTIIINTLNNKQIKINLVGIDLNECIDYISNHNIT